MAQGGSCRDREDQVSAIAERAIGDRIIGDSFFREGADALPVSEPTTPPTTVDLDDTDAPRSILTGDAAVASEPQPSWQLVGPRLRAMRAFGAVERGSRRIVRGPCSKKGQSRCRAFEGS